MPSRRFHFYADADVYGHGDRNPDGGRSIRRSLRGREHPDEHTAADIGLALRRVALYMVLSNALDFNPNTQWV